MNSANIQRGLNPPLNEVSFNYPGNRRNVKLTWDGGTNNDFCTTSL
ncbi:MAG: hypothetical protein AB1815_03370 [Bacillota bacterium]